MIAQGTTTALLLTVEGHDLTGAGRIVLTIKSKGEQLNLFEDRMKVSSDGTDSLVLVKLTQKETLRIPEYQAELQMRWRNADGEAFATEKCMVDVQGAIYNGVI